MKASANGWLRYRSALTPFATFSNLCSDVGSGSGASKHTRRHAKRGLPRSRPAIHQLVGPDQVAALRPHASRSDPQRPSSGTGFQQKNNVLERVKTSGFLVPVSLIRWLPLSGEALASPFSQGSGGSWPLPYRCSGSWLQAVLVSRSTRQGLSPSHLCACALVSSV